MIKRIIKIAGSIALFCMLTTGTYAQNNVKLGMMTVKERKAYEKRAWTALGGTYFFFGGTSGQVVLETGILDDPKQSLSIDGQQYPITVNKKTGRIVARDKNGKIVFDGYCTNGGNSLEGRYKGKKFRVDGSGD